MKNLTYAHQLIEEDDIAAVSAVLQSDFLTCGPEIEKAEAALCEVTKAQHAVLVTSGTAALHLACLAAGVGPGDEVITTPMTFMASANCARYCGADVKFADIDPETWLIDPEVVRRLITERTKAVVAVDYAGEVVDIDALRAICDEHHLVLIEDAAHSIGSRWNGRPVGSLTDLTCFSFHPVKTVTAGEGGAVVTDDAALAERVRMLRSHGMRRAVPQISGGGEGGRSLTFVRDDKGDDLDDKGVVRDDTGGVRDDTGGEEAPGAEPWWYDQVMLGYNYRMTDIQAALLSSQLKKLDRFKARRKEICAAYDKAFANENAIITQKALHGSDACRHLYVIRLNRAVLSCTRRAFFDAMAEKGIRCQVHYIPTNSFSYYKGTACECPNAEALYEDILSIPLYPAMTDEDVSYVTETVRMLTARYRK